MVKNITDTDFTKLVIEDSSNKIILVDFWAPWCGPCLMMTPILESLIVENPTLEIFKLNVDENPSTAGKYNIRSIPTLIAFKNGQPFKTEIGLKNKSQILDMFK